MIPWTNAIRSFRGLDALVTFCFGLFQNNTLLPNEINLPTKSSPKRSPLGKVQGHRMMLCGQRPHLIWESCLKEIDPRTALISLSTTLLVSFTYGREDFVLECCILEFRCIMRVDDPYLIPDTEEMK